MKLFIKKLSFYLRLVINSKWTWKYPKKIFLLVFDENYSENYLKYIDQSQFEILYTRGEVINVPILIRSLIKTFPKKILYNYFEEYIKYSDPKIIISGVDNNTYFWGLKNVFKEKTFVMIQSSKRAGVRNDLFDSLIKNKVPENFYSVDYFFVWGNFIKEEYKKYIKANYIVSGSFINNGMNINPQKNNNIGFISQASIYNYGDKDNIFFAKRMLDSTEVLINHLKKYTKDKNYKIKIFLYNKIGEKNFIFESNFYKERLDGLDYEICHKINKNDNYKELENTKIIIGLTSSILYESLARKNKVAFFNYFAESKIEGYSFGWPNKFPKEGMFWTESTSYSAFRKIFNNLINYNESEWLNLVNKYIPDVIDYDEGNQKFKNLMQKIDIKLI